MADPFEIEIDQTTFLVEISNTGPQGAAGAAGAAGAPGTDGVGVPAGGTTDQVLSKINGTNYNTHWVTPAAAVSDGDKGDITVTGTGSIWTVDPGVITLTKMANMATASFLGRNTAGVGAPEVLAVATAKTLLNLSGTNTGDQTITLTGGVTGSGTGSFAATVVTNANLTGDVTSVGNAATIPNDIVTYAKMQNVSATDKLLGRSTAGAGDVEEIICTAAGRALLDDAAASDQRTTLGLGTLATQSGTFSGTSSGTNTGDQTVSLTGDVTGSGTGSFAATIANDAVTFAKIQNITDARLLGRSAGSTGDMQEITIGANLTLAAGQLSASGGGGGVSDGNYGDITVSGSGTAWAINAAAVTLAKMANIATAMFIGRNTAGTGVPEALSTATAKTMLNLTGTNSGDQTITLTGDVTGSGTGSFAATVANSAITLAKMADMSTASFLGRSTAGTGAVEVLTVAAVKTLLSLAGSNTGDQTITLTGGVTGSGTGSFAATVITNANLTGDVTSSGNASTIANDAVTYAKIQNVSATDKILGRSTAGSGDVEEIACTAAGRALIDDADAAAQRTTLGLGTLATQSGTFSGTSSGTNTGDQTITLTGDVTGSGVGSFAATIATAAVTLAKMSNMATASFLGRNTAGTGVPEVLSAATVKTMLNLTGTNSGDQTITLTGDVTGSGTGSFAATIANSAVTLAKMADVATASFLGRSTAGTGAVEAMTVAAVKTLLSLTGTNSGDQTITLTGGVTGSGTGSFAATVITNANLTGDVTSSGNATTIANNAVTYAKMQDVSATSRLLGRSTAGAGDTEEITASTALDFVGSTRGSILYRGASGWAILAPGTNAYVLTSNGSGADPSYQAAGGGSGGVTQGQAYALASGFALP